MAIPFSKYIQIKDNYCVGYFGKDINIVKSILDHKPLPGIHLYISCSDEHFHLLENYSYKIKRSELEDRLNEFAYFRDVTEENDPLNFLC